MSAVLAARELPRDTSPTAEYLFAEVSRYLPPAAVQSVRRADEFTERAHEGQFRKSGEPYIVHLIATSYYLANLRLDLTSVVAGLLHDTLEDTDVTYDDLEKEFGHAVARIVEGVSKFGEALNVTAPVEELMLNRLSSTPPPNE